jgi:hypothetical protein
MLSSLLVVLALGSPPPQQAIRPSFLFHMEAQPHRAPRLHGQRYVPQPGDLVLFDDHNYWVTKVYRCCGTAGPLHAGLVFRQADGTAAILEAGTNAVQKVFVFPLDNRLHHFHGTILIRRLRTALTPEQSHRLTAFCLAQEGKGYALGRLILHGTPFRPHGTLRSQLFGRTVLDRDRWICSELVVAAMTVAGVLDPQVYPANAMFPRDLCYDERHDLSPHYESAALWYPQAELEYVGAGVRVGDPGTRPAERR